VANLVSYDKINSDVIGKGKSPPSRNTLARLYLKTVAQSVYGQRSCERRTRNVFGVYELVSRFLVVKFSPKLISDESNKKNLDQS